MRRNRCDEIIALIGNHAVFPFDLRDVEEDLPLVLAFYGITDELSLLEEFAIQEGLIANVHMGTNGLSGRISAPPI